MVNLDIYGKFGYIWSIWIYMVNIFGLGSPTNLTLGESSPHKKCAFFDVFEKNN